MEIRSALQKIENYLTVVSNLNKTILSEGTMSRDELLLMKKYLYTSIDRIEDIERSLIIDKSTDKSFTPTETTENKFVPTKQKEIVTVNETDHIDDVEETLSFEQKEVLEDMVEEIQAETSIENTEIVAEIQTPKVEEIPVIENIVANKNEVNETIVEETTIENKVEQIIEITPLVENIITEKSITNKIEIEETIVAETTIENKVEPIVDIAPLIENTIVENVNVINKSDVEQNLVAEKKKEEVSFLDKIKAEVANVTETISAKFEVKKTTTFAEEIANNKKEETSFFEQLEQKQKATKEAQLFELFDDGKDDFHETFAKNNNDTNYETTKVISETSTAFEHENENILVIEKKQVIVETLTPSSLNDVYKPQTLVENITAKSTTTLSESIALNDKFIFVRELFGNQFAEYENALKHIDNLGSYAIAEDYCNNVLWSKFNWTQRASEAGRFMDLMKKKMK